MRPEIPSPPELVVICGPTATGKTEAAIRVAQALGGEVVSADAVQIYRRLDIGSAKPSAEEQALATHHLIDVVEPTERFSAARYVETADAVIADIRRRGRLPVIAGGCGLYIRALLYGLCEAPAANAALRAAMEAEEDTGGPGTLHRRLAEVDPVAAARLHPNDRVRLIRALEVHALTGQPLSAQQAAHGFASPRYRALIFGLDPGAAILRARIDDRAQQMISQGLVAEVQDLLAQGLPPSCPGLGSPGYREIVAHLAGAHDLEETLRLMQRAHWRYARRQRTWFRKTRGLTWLPGPEGLPLETMGRTLKA